jgi:hypothetical protein
MRVIETRELVAHGVGNDGHALAGVILLGSERPPFEEMEIENAPVPASGPLHARFDTLRIPVDRNRLRVGEDGIVDDSRKRAHPSVEKGIAGLRAHRAVRSGLGEPIDGQHAVEPRLRRARGEYVVQHGRGHHQDDERHADAE